MFPCACVFFELSEWVWCMAWAAVNAALAAFAITFTFQVFSLAIFSLAILAGLVAAASWWFQSLGVLAHIFTQLVELFRGQLVKLSGV